MFHPFSMAALASVVHRSSERLPFSSLPGGVSLGSHASFGSHYLANSIQVFLFRVPAIVATFVRTVGSYPPTPSLC